VAGMRASEIKGGKLGGLNHKGKKSSQRGGGRMTFVGPVSLLGSTPERKQKPSMKGKSRKEPGVGGKGCKLKGLRKKKKSQRRG